MPAFLLRCQTLVSQEQREKRSPRKPNCSSSTRFVSSLHFTSLLPLPFTLSVPSRLVPRMPSWTPPVPLCSASQKESFAFESTVKRWPIILTGVVDELNKIDGALSASTDDEQAKLAEGKQLINEISGLIYEMRHDRELSPLQATGLPDDTAAYNDELAQLAEKGQNKWFTSPWLFAECYLYRRLRGLFAVTKHWNLFDPFASQKLSTWRSSAVGAAALAKSLQKLVQEGPVDDEKKLELDLLGMLEVDLWGNATDLSLLTSLTHEEIQQLQSVERGQHFVLKNDFERTWEHFKTLKDARVDIVLDNSAFELYTDMVLADWLVTLSPYVSEVVFHPKLVPWFVSDVQPHDFLILLDTLDDPSFFPTDSGLTEEDRTAFRELAARWKRYVKEGKFRLSVPTELKMGDKGGGLADFWTTPHGFAELPAVAPQLLAELQKASLVIFKGDLNYRKLVGDAWWPTTTPFDDALGPLRGKIDILSLRTCKADTVVGLPEGTEERVEKEDPKWRINGKYAVVSFSPRDS
ncbi:putative Damage-control phosphatase [Rhodotorula toruloides]|nr:putative Damage-control phosphatase [Rhodotorula toruloides]